MIDTMEAFLRQRAYDDYNPELEGNTNVNRDRYCILRWVDKKMAAQIESLLMENRVIKE